MFSPGLRARRVSRQAIKASASLKEYGGLKGVWNWLMGRGLPTGKERYSKMVDEADDMIMAMEEGREVDILQEVMRYSGLEAGER